MAKIIDLKKYNPSKGEMFFVDTNVWYWFTYVPSKVMQMAKKPLPYQVADYAAFIEKALNNHAHLYHCPLNLAELSGIIETAEFDYYNMVNGSTIKKKAYRKIAPERAGVSNEINLAWATISSLSSHMATVLTESSENEVLTSFPLTSLDTYDCFYTQLMKQNGIVNIISDDGDFGTCPTSTVFTSNKRLLHI
jgi:predicted nucleic acid-binding protein